MRYPLLMLLAALAPAQALAGGLVVWMEPAIPEERPRERAEKLSAADVHLALADLAVPPSPPADADGQRYAQLRETVIRARERWDDFEVEFGIAAELEAALEAIDVVRDDRDLDALVEAYALQGAAVSRAFEADEFQSGDRARPFRTQVPGDTHPWNRPWLNAMAVHPARRLVQSEAETATWPVFNKFQEETSALPDATLDLSTVPAGFIPVVDGQAIAAGKASLALRPGRHYLHALRDGVFHGRARITVTPGQAVTFPILVGADEALAARAQVLAESTTGFPEDVKTALEALTAYYAGPVFVAALNESHRVVIVPYARGAMLISARPLTFLVTGELGPEAVVSPLFDANDGNLVTATGLSGALGIALGIFNAAIVGGMDLAITPGHTVKYANSDATGNIATSALPQPWGGLGGYILRPVGDSPYLLIAGTAGWDAPAHVGLGGRITFGLPTQEERWVHLTLGATTAARSMWDEGDAKTPMHVLFARFGFGHGL